MWNKMETFYHIVKAGSFTKAEKILNKSQTTLTYSVQVLEERLGCQLLHRSVKGLILTRKGEEVFQTAQRMVMDMEGLKKNLHGKDALEGKIRVSTTHAIANYILADLLLEFNELYPKITFEFFCNDDLIDIVQNEVDVAIRPYDPHDSHSIQVPLFTLQAQLYASREYIKKNGNPETLEDLSAHKFISFSRPEKLYGEIDWFFKMSDKISQKNCVLQANTVEMHFKAAQAGRGIIASYEKMSILRDSGLVNVAPQIIGPKYEDYFVYPKRLKKLKRIQVLLEFLLEKMGEVKKSS